MEMIQTPSSQSEHLGVDIQQTLIRTGVLQKGHFLLSSGRHSDQYLQCAQLLKNPQEAEKIGEKIAHLFHDVSIDVVVGPALGGVVIAHEIARSLGVCSLFTERKDGKMELRRGFSLNSGERVLIVEDVVTTGGSVREVMQVLEELDAEIVGIGAIVNRCKEASFRYPFRSCISISASSYLPEECLLCQEGVPIEKPGSRVLDKKL